MESSDFEKGKFVQAKRGPLGKVVEKIRTAIFM